MLESDFKLKAGELEKELKKIKNSELLKSDDSIVALKALAVLISELDKKGIFTVLKNLSYKFIHINLRYEIYVINDVNKLFEKADKNFMNCHDSEKAQQFLRSGIKDLSNILWEMEHCPIFGNK